MGGCPWPTDGESPAAAAAHPSKMFRLASCSLSIDFFGERPSIKDPLFDAHAYGSQRRAWVQFSVAFALSHGCATTAIVYASTLLGDDLADASLAVMYFAYEAPRGYTSRIHVADGSRRRRGCDVDIIPRSELWRRRNSVETGRAQE